MTYLARSRRISMIRPFAALLCALLAFPSTQALDNNTVVHGIDASVATREDNLLGYIVTEHYSVFRNQEKEHPAAEMTVKTTYRRDKGKSYQILGQSGSDLILKQVLGRVLDSEHELTQPANRTHALINSTNYNMAIKSEEKVGTHDCIVLSIAPKHSSPYVFTGTLWVDAQDESILQLEGIAAKSPSMLTGPAQVSRTYEKIDGFPMATHATATSSSWLLGQTTIQIEYTGYQIQASPAHP